MPTKSRTAKEGKEKATKNRSLGTSSRREEKTSHRKVAERRVQEQRVQWVKSDMDGLGHGVQFLHDELRDEFREACTIAFLEGYNWYHRPGSPATVRLLGMRPPSITEDHWFEMTECTREAIHLFLSNKDNWTGSFRHGPIHVIFNC